MRIMKKNFKIGKGTINVRMIQIPYPSYILCSSKIFNFIFFYFKKFFSIVNKNNIVFIPIILRIDGNYE